MPKDFDDALFEGVVIGPRREVTLKLKPVVWAGHLGHYAFTILVRFGGIVNFEEVEVFFAAGCHERSELGRLRYDTQHSSKPGNLYLHLAFERVETSIIIHCHSLTVTEPEPQMLE